MGAQEKPPRVSPAPTSAANLQLPRQMGHRRVTPDVASRLRTPQASRPRGPPWVWVQGNFHLLSLCLLARQLLQGSAGPISQAVPLRITQPNARSQIILGGRWAPLGPKARPQRQACTGSGRHVAFIERLLHALSDVSTATLTGQR